MINDVELLYKLYQEYISHEDKFDRNTIANFARANIDHKLDSLKMITMRISQKINGPSNHDFDSFGNVGILHLIAEDMKVKYAFFFLNTFSEIYLEISIIDPSPFFRNAKTNNVMKKDNTV